MELDDFDDEIFDDEPLDAGDPVDLGACCVCGAEGDTVRNIVMLNFQAPIGGEGWACMVCGLPPNGALAVVCDACAETKTIPDDLRYVVSGLAGNKERAAIDTIEQIPFEHDLSRHPEYHPALENPEIFMARPDFEPPAWSRRNPFYILNDEHEPIPASLLEWAEWFENYDNRQVARHEIGPLVVSTVCLGLDHSFGDGGPPVLFETMVFHNGEDRAQYRAYTWEDALECHNSIVAFLMAGVAPELDGHSDGHSHGHTDTPTAVERVEKPKKKKR